MVMVRKSNRITLVVGLPVARPPLSWNPDI